MLKAKYLKILILIHYLSRVISIPLVVFGVVGPPKAGTQTKIRQFDMTISVDQNVIRLDVSMDETHLMNTFHGTNKLRNIKSI